MPPLGDLAESQPHSFIVIQDPVASKSYILNPDKKIAHVMDNSNRGYKGGKPGPDFEGAGEPTNPNVTKESLGTQTIGGVSAQGTRYTHVIPAGKIGFGESSYSLTNIQRTEPAASLFTVPSDYTVQQGKPGKGMRRGKMPPPPPADAPPAPGL